MTRACLTLILILVLGCERSSQGARLDSADVGTAAQDAMSRIADASMMNDLALAPIIDMAIAEPEVGPSNDLPCDPLSQSDDDWDRDGLSDREEQMEGTSSPCGF